MGHACEFETAMMLQLRPDLVELHSAEICYPETGSAYLTTDLLMGSAVRTYQDFADLSSTGTLGDPSLADREHGEQFYRAATDELVRFIEDFATWPIQAKA